MEFTAPLSKRVALSGNLLRDRVVQCYYILIIAVCRASDTGVKADATVDQHAVNAAPPVTRCHRWSKPSLVVEIDDLLDSCDPRMYESTMRISGSETLTCRRQNVSNAQPRKDQVRVLQRAES